MLSDAAVGRPYLNRTMSIQRPHSQTGVNVLGGLLLFGFLSSSPFSRVLLPESICSTVCDML